MKVTSDAQKELSAAAESESLCFVLEWDESDALGAAEGLPSRRERRAAIEKALSQVKEPVLAALRARPTVDVNDLEGTGHAVVAATAEQWRQLLGHPVLAEARVKVIANELFEAH